MFAKRDKHYPRRSVQTSLAAAIAKFTKPVGKNYFGPSTQLMGSNIFGPSTSSRNVAFVRITALKERLAKFLKKSRHF